MGLLRRKSYIEGCYQMISCRPVCPETAAEYGMVRMMSSVNLISQMKIIL